MGSRPRFTYENALVVILGLTFGVVFFDRQAAANLMPLIKPDLRLDNTQVGLIGSALSVTWALSAYGVGLISDRTGRRKLVLIACVVGFSLCSVVSGFADSLVTLILSRLLMGLLEGGVMPVCLAIMAQESSERRRALNAGIVQNVFANLIGNTAGPIILAAIAVALGWRQAFYLSALPGLLCAGAIWLWVKEPPKVNIGAGDNQVAPGGFLPFLRTRNVLICTLISIFMVAWTVTNAAFLPTYMVENRHLSLEATSTVMSMVGVGALAGGLTLPALSDRLGRKPVMLIGCLGSIVAPLSALYFHGALWAVSTLQFVGWMSAGVFPLFMATIPGESLPRAEMATAMGLVVGVGELFGGVFGPLLAGRLADGTAMGLEAPIAMVAGCSLVAVLLSLLLVESYPGAAHRSGNSERKATAAAA